MLGHPSNRYETLTAPFYRTTTPVIAPLAQFASDYARAATIYNLDLDVPGNAYWAEIGNALKAEILPSSATNSLTNTP